MAILKEVKMLTTISGNKHNLGQKSSDFKTVRSAALWNLFCQKDSGLIRFERYPTCLIFLDISCFAFFTVHDTVTFS